MFLHFWRSARWFFLAGGIFVTGIVCAMFVKYPFEKIGDLATWVGAVGTVGALIGTIWIATSQQRKADQEARSLGEVTLISTQFRMNTLRRQLEKWAIALDKWQPVDPHFINYKDAGETIRRYVTLEVSEVERIRALDKSVCLGMAAALDYIAYSTDILVGASNNPKILTGDQHLVFCKQMSELLASAAMSCRAAGVLAARIAGRDNAIYEDNGIREIALRGFHRKA